MWKRVLENSMTLPTSVNIVIIAVKYIEKSPIKIEQNCKYVNGSDDMISLNID